MSGISNLIININNRQGLKPYAQRSSWAYGVIIDETQANPDLERCGNASFAKAALVCEQAIQGTLNVDTGYLKKFNKTNGLLYADGTASIVDGSAGQVVSYMPPFYYNVEAIDSNKYKLWVSTYPIIGFSKHPGWCVGSFKATVNNTAIFGKPVNSLWSVKNESTVFRGGNNSSTNDSLQKGFLEKPRTSLSRTQFYTYAQNQNTQCGLIDYNTHLGLFMLFATKYATLNSQKAIASKSGGYFAGGLGNGLTTIGSTDWSNYNGYNPLAKCGLTLSLGLTDGEVSLVLSSFNAFGDLTVKQNSFMGIEAPFGDIWEWVQGINLNKVTTSNFIAYIYASNIYEDAITTGKYLRSFSFSNSDGWLKAIIGGQYFDLLAKTIGSGASSSTYFTDYFYNDSSLGLRGLMRGSSAYYGSSAGLAAANAYHGFADTSTYIGSRFGFYGRVRPVL